MCSSLRVPPASNIAPENIVMYMDVRYTGFAGAKTGHMGVASSIKPVPNSKHKTSPSSSEDELVLY